MVGYVSLWWGMFHAVFYYGGDMFHNGGVCFIMVGDVSLWCGMFHYVWVCFIVMAHFTFVRRKTWL